MLNPLKNIFSKKVGLVLGSGGAKGIAHIAVIDFLQKEDIPIDMVAGSSIGAVIGALLCADSLDRFRRDLLAMKKKDMIALIDPVFPKSGFVQGKKAMEFLEHYIPRDTAIEDLAVPLAVCATEYYTGMTVVFRRGSLFDALRASISIPGILVPFSYRGTLLIDGGVANPLPVNIVKKMGATTTIAVNLHPRVGKKRLRSFVRSEMHRFRLAMAADEIDTEDAGAESGDDAGTAEAPGIPPAREEDHSGEETPGITDLISKSIDIMEYVNTMLMLKYNRPSVLIEPDVTRFGTFDLDKAAEIMAEGRKSVEIKRKALVRKVNSWF